MNDRYTFARALARKAGALALDYWNRREQLVVELKGPGDFVSVADREVERLVRTITSRQGCCGKQQEEPALHSSLFGFCTVE